MPTVSVAIAAYNAAAYLREALLSVLAQTSPPDEIIVVDDGSTDDTRAVCESFGTRVRYIHQPNDGTMGAGARGRAMTEAQGDWIAILDHDDLWHRDKLRVQLAAVEKYPDAVAVFTDHTVIGDDEIRARSPSTVAPVRQLEARDAFHLLLQQNPYYPSSALVKRQFILEGGLPDPKRMGCADWDLSLAIARRHPIVIISEPLTLYRVSPDQYSADLGRLSVAVTRSIEAQVPELHEGCETCRESLAIGRRFADQIHRMAARRFLDGYHRAIRRGELHAAGACLRKALTASPREVLPPRRLAAVVKNALRGLLVAAGGGPGRAG